ncbi:MAG: F0F1 ATP synthase subunit epsilon [Zetaproteobacteria bacterium]|nr:F0F1 ATP synthase subunit epsilon [Zetaproteobacteria bacterium]
MSSFEVLVATAEREVYRGQADFVVAPGAAGELGIMPKHTPLLSALCAGELKITRGEDIDEVFISGGFLEVQPDCITVLADTAERASDVDEAVALEAERKAKDVVDTHNSEMDYARAANELAIATARLAFLRKRKK